MNFGDRPGDWLGYAPGESPLREKGGPMSPKKKTMNWRVARDMQLSKEQDKVASASATTTTAIKPVPDIEKSPSASKEEHHHEGASTDDSSSTGSEAVVELVTEEHDDDEEVEEIVEYDEDDEESEYEEEVIDEDSDVDEDDSLFEPLPPPIEIPNALKPVHLRTPEPAAKPKIVLATRDGSSSSDDDDEDDAESIGGDDDSIKEAPRVAPQTVRPSAVRGHSCDDDIEAMSKAVRGGKKPAKSDNTKPDSDDESSSNGEKEVQEDANEDGIKMAPRVAPRSVRPGIVRGHSCDDEIKEMSQQVRGGRKPEKKEVDGCEELAVEAKETPAVVSPRSLRPGTVRGHSFDKDIQAMSDSVQGPRGGRRPSKKETEEDEAEAANPLRPSKVRGHSLMHPDAPTDATNGNETAPSSPPVSPLRPTTLRGHSCDKELEEMNNSIRGGKRPDASKKPDYRTLRDAQPTSPKANYRSLRDSVPTTPKASTSNHNAPRSPLSAAKAPTTPKTPTRSYNAPKTPTRASTTPMTPGRSGSLRGEDTAPPTPCYTRVDEYGVEHKEYTWEKPAWATNNALRATPKGEKLKQGSDISRPIGGIKPVD